MSSVSPFLLPLFSCGARKGHVSFRDGQINDYVRRTPYGVILDSIASSTFVLRTLYLYMLRRRSRRYLSFVCLHLAQSAQLRRNGTPRRTAASSRPSVGHVRARPQNQGFGSGLFLWLPSFFFCHHCSPLTKYAVSVYMSPYMDCPAIAEAAVR